jgi:hypothetical protein
VTPAPTVTDAHRRSWQANGFYRIDGFAPPEVGQAMLADVLPGSHAEPVHEHVPDRRPGANYGYVEIVDHDTGRAEPVLMAPGDLLVFDSHLMHRSTDNESDGIRAAMVFHFACAGTRDLTERATGRPSSVNDWVAVVRDGEAVLHQ